MSGTESMEAISRFSKALPLELIRTLVVVGLAVGIAWQAVKDDTREVSNHVNEVEKATRERQNSVEHGLEKLDRKLDDIQREILEIVKGHYK